MRCLLFTILVLFACEADPSPASPPLPVQLRPPFVEYVLAEKPVFAVGLADGPEEYLFRDIAGAVRLGNGDVVVAVRGYHEVRRFGPDGRHLWTSGRRGSGPGEFQYLNLLEPCTDESSIVVHDSYNHFVTTFDRGGAMVSTDRFERFPWGLGLTCAPNGRLVFSDWSDAQSTEATFRWTNGLAYADEPDSRIRVLEEALPGDERFNVIQNGRIAGEGPRPWGKSLVFAPTDDGVWYATGDTYELALAGSAGKGLTGGSPQSTATTTAGNYAAGTRMKRTKRTCAVTGSRGTSPFCRLYSRRSPGSLWDATDAYGWSTFVARSAAASGWSSTRMVLRCRHLDSRLACHYRMLAPTGSWCADTPMTSMSKSLRSIPWLIRRGNACRVVRAERVARLGRTWLL